MDKRARKVLSDDKRYILYFDPETGEQYNKRKLSKEEKQTLFLKTVGELELEVRFDPTTPQKKEETPAEKTEVPTAEAEQPEEPADDPAEEKE